MDRGICYLLLACINIVLIYIVLSYIESNISMGGG